ncbi:uncharacterized protein LOC114758552 [Neltuma alba]|uniref:uncharacterized protein LOC114758552 n=1 Tax=Neltuma alba TaxID=207710 RepID=UPI0010A4C3A4|nr:uncharacterized protein LOC114758552 [Prosopis alba]
MYVTRPRSLYKRDPEALLHPAPEGPYSGYLVLQDDEEEEDETHTCLRNFPFPQNRKLSVLYPESSRNGATVYKDGVMFIPALNQPLSSNHYYVIHGKGTHQGEASTSSNDKDMGTCFCCNYIKDVKPRPLNPSDEYQRFEIVKKRWGFQANSVAPNGFPPLFLRRSWTLSTKTPQHYHLSEALGIDHSLRHHLPPFTLPSSQSDHSEAMVIGKWYCPFMFVKEEGMSLKKQMKKSVFYEMTFERRWDKVFSKENSEKSNEVLVDTVVKTQVAEMDGGREAVWEKGRIGDERVTWFKSLEGGERRVALSKAIVERMRWEGGRSDWVGRNNKEMRVKRVEKIKGMKKGKWRNFGLYVLVESFMLKRMDESFVLTHDFRYSNHVKCTWE